MFWRYISSLTLHSRSTFGEIANETVQFASLLCQFEELKDRCFVGICSENRTEWLISDFACAYNDFVSVGLHKSWPQSYMEYVVNDAELSCVITTAALAPKFINVAKAGSSLRILVIMGVDNVDGIFDGSLPETLTVVPFNRCRDFASSLCTRTGAGYGCLAGLGVDDDVRVHEELEPFTLMYTSGTTGRPKGVVVSKKRWRNDAMASGFVGQDDPTAISYMALAHGGDRGICWQVACVCSLALC